MLVSYMRKPFYAALPFLLLVLLGNIMCEGVSAQQVMHLTKKTSNLNAISYTHHFEDQYGNTSFEALRQPGNSHLFAPDNKELLSYGLTDAAIWLHGAVDNTVDNHTYLLFEYANIDTITLYYYQAGVLHTMHAGSHFPLSNNAFRSPGYSFSLPADTLGRPQEFWVRVKSGNSLIIPMTISTFEGLWHSYVRMYAAELIYAGILLALLFYNLSLYVWVRDRSYLYYLGYLFTLGAFVLLYLRGFRVFLGQGAANFFCNYGFSMVAISYMFGLHFALSFLQGDVFAPRLSRILRFVGHSMWILVFCNIAGWRTLVIREEQVISLLTPLLLIVLAAVVYRKKYKPAIYFLVAWSLLLGAIIYFAASVMGLLPVESWTLHALTIGSGIEMILLSFALGFRYLLLKRETASLQQAGMEMMKEHNARLEREVTARTNELQQTLVSLTASNKVKDKLLGIVSHDIKAPLNNLYWLLDQMEPGATSVERISRLKLEVGIELKRMSLTMDNILNWSLTQLNNIEPRPEAVPVSILLKQVAEETTLAAKKKQITLQVNVPGSLRVWADHAQLRLVLLNLLHNAVKFTGEGGRIQLSAEPVSGTNAVEIAISDNGIGMTQEEASRLLHERNVQSRQGTAKEPGTGMGILLCKEFVAANGGELYLFSEVGAGSRFYFQLPACK